MLKVPLLVWLLFPALFIFPGASQGQFILAGEHPGNTHYVDIVPDTTLTGPYNHPPGLLPPVVYPIDINGDNRNEFFISAVGSWMNGGGGTDISIRSFDKNVAQIAYGSRDRCFYSDTIWVWYETAKSLKSGDTISHILTWHNDSILPLYRYSWSVGYGSCATTAFVNDSLGNYIGVRLISSSDTMYGWIKVTNVNFLSFTVQEFAFGKNTIGIDEPVGHIRIYPNPSHGIFNIETQFPDFDLMVYDHYGLLLMKQEHISGNIRVDIIGRQSGIYYLKFIAGKTVLIRKVFKIQATVQ